MRLLKLLGMLRNVACRHDPVRDRLLARRARRRPRLKQLLEVVLLAWGGCRRGERLAGQERLTALVWKLEGVRCRPARPQAHVLPRRVHAIGAYQRA